MSWSSGNRTRISSLFWAGSRILQELHRARLEIHWKDRAERTGAGIDDAWGRTIRTKRTQSPLLPIPVSPTLIPTLRAKYKVNLSVLMAGSWMWSLIRNKIQTAYVKFACLTMPSRYALSMPLKFSFFSFIWWCDKPVPDPLTVGWGGGAFVWFVMNWTHTSRKGWINHPLSLLCIVKWIVLVGLPEMLGLRSVVRWIQIIIPNALSENYYHAGQLS